MSSFVNDLSIFLHQKYARGPRRPKTATIMIWLIIGFFVWFVGGIVGLIFLGFLIHWYVLIAIAVWLYILILWFQFNTWYDERY